MTLFNGKEWVLDKSPNPQELEIIKLWCKCVGLRFYGGNLVKYPFVGRGISGISVSMWGEILRFREDYALVVSFETLTEEFKKLIDYEDSTDEPKICT